MIDPVTEPVDIDAVAAIQQLVEQIEKVIRGKRKQIEMVVTCLLAGGHILMEDNTRTGRTVLAHTHWPNASAEKRKRSMWCSSASSLRPTCAYGSHRHTYF